jgi:hypothetical protein
VAGSAGAVRGRWGAAAVEWLCLLFCCFSQQPTAHTHRLGIRCCWEGTRLTAHPAPDCKPVSREGACQHVRGDEQAEACRVKHIGRAATRSLSCEQHTLTHLTRPAACRARVEHLMQARAKGGRPAWHASVLTSVCQVSAMGCMSVGVGQARSLLPWPTRVQPPNHSHPPNHPLKVCVRGCRGLVSKAATRLSGYNWCFHARHPGQLYGGLQGLSRRTHCSHHHTTC